MDLLKQKLILLILSIGSFAIPSLSDLEACSKGPFGDCKGDCESTVKEKGLDGIQAYIKKCKRGNGDYCTAIGGCLKNAGLYRDAAKYYRMGCEDDSRKCTTAVSSIVGLGASSLPRNILKKACSLAHLYSCCTLAHHEQSSGSKSTKAMGSVCRIYSRMKFDDPKCTFKSACQRDGETTYPKVSDN
jgi:hypothetical protein